MAGAISPRAARALIALGAAAVLTLWWHAALAVTGHTSPGSETATLLTTYPDVAMATAAWFLLLGVGLVSARAARRRLRYETWYYMTGTAVAALTEAGVPRRRIRYESFEF